MTPPTDQTSTASGLISTPSLLRRMSCWLYEGMLLFAVVFMASYLFSTLTQTRHALQNRLGQQVFIFLVLGFYFTWFWRKGQTLAMKTWHIKVVSADGVSPIRPTQAVVRYLLTYVWFVPGLVLAKSLQMGTTGTVWTVLGWVAIWAMLSKLPVSKQFVHDRIAKTALISVEPKAR